MRDAKNVGPNSGFTWQPHLRPRFAPFTILPLVWLLGLASLPAAPRVWRGGAPGDPTCASNNLWTNPCNWSGRAIPGPGDDLTFPASIQGSSSNNYGNGTSFRSLAISDGHIILGNAIGLDAGITLANAQVLLSAIKLNLDQSFNAPNAATGGLINSVIDTNGKKLTLEGEGPIQVTGLIAGSGNLEKDGPGIVQLFGNNPYTGSTRINRGTLLVFGAQPQSDVLIAGGDFIATLGGSGTVGAITATSNGNIAPGAAGDAMGVLSSAGSVTLVANQFAQLKIDIKGTNPGSGYDRLNVGTAGTLDLGDDNLLDVTIGGSFAPAPGNTFLIVDNKGPNPVIGTFRDKPEGSTFTENGTTFVISYQGGDGNDVILRVSTIRTWDGGGADANWMTPANWAGDVAPLVGDSLVFPPIASRRTNVNNYPDGTAFDALVFTGPFYFLDGNAIVLSSGLLQNSSANSSNTVRLIVGGRGGTNVQSGISPLLGRIPIRGRRLC